MINKISESKQQTRKYCSQVNFKNELLGTIGQMLHLLNAFKDRRSYIVL